MKRGLIIILMLLSFLKLKAKDDETIVYTDRAYLPTIKTVQLYLDPLVLSDPVIPLHGASQLHLEFDDLDGDKKNYYYTFIHCNFDWTPTDLSTFDYLQGFEGQDILTFTFSFNTNQSYTHYELLFPNENIRPTKSGNYVIKVYADNNPENIVLTRRFIVFDSKATITADVHKPYDARYTDAYQEVDFLVGYKGLYISNPLNDVKVLLMQNFRWDNAKADLPPLFMRPSELDYTYDMKNAFPAGKEFRYFDTRSIRYRTDRVADIQSTEVKTEVFIVPDVVRGGQVYFYYKDINGKFVPGIIEGFNQKAEPDYAWVNFFVPFDYPLRSLDVYLVGKFSDWQLKDDFQLRYNAERHGYEGRVYLKQGYYEYELVTAEKGSTTGDVELIEGNWFETENTYQIFVYYRSFGSRYDEVIGYKAMNSFNK